MEVKCKNNLRDFLSTKTGDVKVGKFAVIK